MYTIHQGINGGWYGSVEAPDIETALRAAQELSRALATLRTDNPKPARAPRAPGTLTPEGTACLDYLRANPRALNEDYVPAGHSQRTVTWLAKNGFLRFNADNSWTVLDRA